MKIFNLQRVMQTALLLLLMTGGATKVFAQDFYVDNIQYYVTNGNNVEVGFATVIGNTLTIPSTITYENQMYTVVGIRSYAFEFRYDYTRYELPNTMTYIGIGAFKNSIIESIQFSDNLTYIGSGAFEGCESLTVLNLTNCTNMTTINQSAFRGMPNVWLIKLPESITTIETGAFSGCTKLSTIDLPGSITTIGNSAFNNCSSLKSLTLPQSVNELGINLFDGCTAFKDLYVQSTTPPSASFQTFDGWYQNYAEHVYVPYGSESTYQVATGWSNLYANNLITETNTLVYEYNIKDIVDAVATVTGHIGNVVGALDIPDYSKHHSTFYKVTAVANEAFAHCTDITSVTFGEFMEDLGHDAFESCSGITSVDLSACRNMTEIGETAFQGCIGLTSVTLPPTLLSVGNYAFYNCGLTSITLPSHVMSLGSGAFCSCHSLAIITSMNPVPPTVGDQVFYGSDNITKIKVPYGAKTDYLNAPVWGSFDESIYEEMSPAFSFYYDDDYQIAIVLGYNGIIPSVVEIPATVTKNDAEYTVKGIDGSAFKNQTGVSQFILPNTITAIGPDAFRGCRYADINIPESLTSLGEGAFVDCDHLTSVTLPEGLTSIPALAFYSCSFITELRLPSTLTSIGIRAFANCSNLENIVTYATTPPACEVGNGNDSFLNVSCVVHVPVGCYNAYHTAAGWSNLYIEQGSLTYMMNVDNTEAIITGVLDYTFGDLVIPEMMNNRPVTTIAENAFRNKSGITSISMPASVTTIGAQAFANCSDLTAINVDANNESYKSVDGVLFSKNGNTLVAYPAGKTETSFTIPASVESITNYAFEGNKHLTTIQLSAAFNLISHVPSAFYGIDNLEAITVDAGNTYFKAIDGVLFSDDETNLIYCPRGKAGHYTVPSTVTYILYQAFADCSKLTGVTLNDGLQSIEMYAFARSTGLTSISIPEGITNIYMCTFMGCSNLKTVSLPTTLNNIEQCAFANTGLISLTLPSNIEHIGSNAFADCENIGEITCIATVVPTTDADAFKDVPSDIPVYVPAGSISAYQNATGWSQFTNIQAITDPNLYITYSYNDNDHTATVTGVSQQYSGALVIPGTVTYNNTIYTVTAIANHAFENNTVLTSVDIAHTVETIGEYAFMSCTSLTDLIIGRNVKTIGKYAFSSCSSLTNIVYYAVGCENVATSIWSATTAPNKTLTIKNSVRSIPDFAFSDLGNLASVTIPDNTESIGTYAFSNCTELTTVTFGYKLKTVGPGAFKNSGITSIDMNNVENAYDGAFSNCINLSTVTLRNSMTQIWSNLFAGCTALESVDIPSAVTYIGPHAFSGCTSLATLSTAGYASNLTTIDKGAFRDCTALTSIDIPNSVTSINDNAFYGAYHLKNITIGTGLQSMGSAVFCLCSALENITYNATHCHTFGSMVWSGTGGNAKTLTIGANVEVIPPRAFESLLGFTTVTLPNALTLIRSNAFKGCSLTEITIPNNVTEIEYDAFLSCNLQTIVLGSKLNNIGSYAFAGNANIAEITSYNTTPPAVTGNTFSTYDATLKVLAPAINAYNAHSVWSLFTNTESLDGYYFTGATDSNWGTASNWSNGEVPVSDPIMEYIGGVWNENYNADYTPNVVILADATVNIPNAFANKLNIMDGNVVTVTNGNKLYIGNLDASFVATDASALVIEEGGQLWNNVDVEATVKKGIAHYSDSRNGYHFIASPLGAFYGDEADWADPMAIEGMIASTPRHYDLYRFDQTAFEAEWQNYKANPFVLRNGWGYLYANANDVTLEFAGKVVSNECESQLDLVFTDGYVEVPFDPENPEAGCYNEPYPFAGWNLMGNPFACDAYLSSMSSGFESLNFYRMNETGNAVEAVENVSGTSIPSCTGIFVKTPDQGTSSISFVRELDPMMMSANQGSLHIALEQAAMRGASVKIDNAIVSFNEGSTLEKFVLFEDNARIYIPQNGKDYAIVSSEGSGEMPMNFKAVDNGKYTITVNPSNVEMAYLHLIDNLTGDDINLLETPSYTFDGGQGNYASRFRLVYSISGDANGDNAFAYFDGNSWVIGNTGRATLQIVDVMGRILRSGQIDGNATLNPNGLSTGVYIMQLINGENVKTQKIVVR